MADISTIPISGLNTTNAAASDLIEVAQVNAQSSTGYASMRTSLSSVGILVNTLIQYSSELTTTDKTIIGAINELKDAIDNLQTAIDALGE